MRAIVFLVAAMITGCSAPTPLRSTDAPVDNDARLPASGGNNDNPPMGDAVCLSSEQFDAFADFECPAVEAASCPAVEVTCEDAPVTVTCECPDVTVTCEPEIMEVPTEAGCPTPEVCEPEVVEVEVASRLPSFQLLISPVAVDPSDTPETQYHFLDVVLLGGGYDVRVTQLWFRLRRHGGVWSGYDYGYWDVVEVCDVFDCESLRLYHNRDRGEGVSEVIVDEFAMPAGAPNFGTPSTWAGHELAADAQDYLSWYARAREDAPPGRYSIEMYAYEIQHDGVEQSIRDLPIFGPEFTIAEDTIDTPTCAEQPFVRVWGLVPESRNTALTRKLVVEINAMDCDLQLDNLQVGIRAVVDYDGGGGEQWTMYNRGISSLMDEYHATIGTESVAYIISLGDVPALDASLQTGEGMTYLVPAHETALFTVYAAMHDDAPTGRYLFSLEGLNGMLVNTGERMHINGMPMHGQQFEL